LWFIDRNGRFRHIGGHDDLLDGHGFKDAALLRSGKPGEQGKDRAVLDIAALEQIAGFPDILLRGHEDQDVAPLPLFPEVFNGLYGCIDIGEIAFFLRLRIDGTILDVHRVHASGHLNDGCIVEGPGELLRVDRGGRDDHLEVPPDV
jgi:hypothetical protein